MFLVISHYMYCLCRLAGDVKMFQTRAITRAMAVMTRIAKAQSSVLRNSGGVGVVVGGLCHVELSKSIMNSKAWWNLALSRALWLGLVSCIFRFRD